MGLLDALYKFEPERDLKFHTYASFRIRGAIIDGLRKEDWLPRTLRDKAKQIEAVTVELEQELQRVPTAKEIAQQIGVTESEVEEIVKDSLYANILSIESKQPDHQAQQTETIAYSIIDEQTKTPEQQLLSLEINDELMKGIQKLSDNEQLVISLFYHDELTMTEIGEVLSLTTSRISQIHKRAIFKLRKILKKVQMIS